MENPCQRDMARGAIGMIACANMWPARNKKNSLLQKMHVVCALVRLDYTCLRVALVLHWPAFQQHRLLWCFTGYYFVDDKRSHTAWRSSCAPDYTLFRCYLLTFKLAWLMSMAVLAPLLWCFTGQHFTHFWCSRVSLATISLTVSIPTLRGAPPARPFIHFSDAIC